MLKHQIYIIRHGTTDWNLIKRFQGHQDVSLNEEGFEQARQTAIELQTVNLDRIYTSDLSRARQTAYEIKKKQKNALFIETNKLREGYGGELEGKIFTKKIGKSEIQSLNSLRNMLKHSGETTDHIKKRVLPYLDEIINNLHRPSNIAIVSHGGPIRLIVGNIQKLNDNEAVAQKLKNCSITKLENVDTEWRLVYFNKHDHLQYRKSVKTKLN